MKIHLAQIPEEGLRLPLRLKLAALPRLIEAIGEQSGEVTGELTLRNREGNVEVEGMVRATLHPPCQRCLEPVAVEIDDAVYVALVPEREYEQGPEDLHLGLGDLEVSYYEGEELDVGHIVEDELLLLIPEPVADEDEQGRCVICGKSSEALFPEEPDKNKEHPFAQLKHLLHNE